MPSHKLRREWIDIKTGDDNQFMGCRPRDDKLGAEFPVYEETMEVISRDQWQDLNEDNTSLELLVRKIKNQGREGTCASNATGQGQEITWNKTFGLAYWMEFSPISVYRWIANGPNTGSTIGANLRQLRNTGMLPVDNEANRKILELAGANPEHVLDAVGYYQRFPEGWTETASLFRCDEYFDIGTFDGLISALFYDLPVVYGRAGHAICGVKPHYYNGVWYIKYANSWGDWGDEGYGYDSESYVSRAIRSHGAFAQRTTYIPEQIVNAIADMLQDDQLKQLLVTAA